MGLSYKDAGVDIDAGNQAVDKLSESVKETFGPEVLTGLGGFGALFAPDLSDYQQPVFVSGTDGVGTKLKVAFRMDKHDSIGFDLVAMAVNDILTLGAKPLFFLDYMATGKLNPDKVAEVVKGIANACKEANLALIGGETAEMPDFYSSGEYDLAGFVVGMVDKPEIIDGSQIKAGDKIIALPSSGIHSNGYSLARKAFFEVGGYSVDDQIDGLDEKLGVELLKPTRIYVDLIHSVLDKYELKGIANITGGGMVENIPRVLPEGLDAVIDKASLEIPAIFDLLQEIGDIKESEMYRTFNMGVGMALVVDEKLADEIVAYLDKQDEKAYIIGQIKEGNGKVQFS